MINLTNRPLLTCTPEELTNGIIGSWGNIYTILFSARSERKKTSNTDYNACLKIYQPLTFGNFNSRELELIELLYSLSQTDNFSANDANKYGVLLNSEIKGPNELQGLKTPIRALLVHLWSRHLITLPMNFKHTGIDWIEPNIYERTDSFVLEIAKSNTNEPKHQNKYRKLMYASSWRSPKDVDQTELFEAVKSIYLNPGFRKGSSRIVAWTKLFAKKYPDQIDARTPRAFNLYALTTNNPAVELKDETIEELWARDELTKVERRKASDLKYIAKIKSALPVEKPDADIDSVIHKFSLLTKRPKRGSIKEILTNYYPPNPEIDINRMSENWLPYINYFLAKEKRRIGSRSRKMITREIYLLMDYLFYFLPRWWIVTASRDLEYPYSPHKFHRIYFWHRDEELDIGDLILPPTALALYSTRKSRATKSQFINAIDNFFRHCANYDREMNTINSTPALAEIKNPVDKKYDSDGSGSRIHSDKVPFPLRSIPFLRAYFRAIEHIGRSIQTKCLNNEIQVTEEMTKSEWLDLTTLDVQTVITTKLNGESLTIDINKIPNVFSWHYGEYITPDNHRVFTNLPWLSIPRMLITEFFTGQRMQNLQWLDLDEFDKYTINELANLYLTLIYITTDKTNPYRVALIQKDIMEMLNLEKDFQTKTCHTPPIPVYYETDDRQYGEFRPLFRSPRGLYDNFGAYTGKPYGDESYSRVWRMMLLGAQEIFNTHNKEKHLFVYLNPVGKKNFKDRWVPIVSDIKDYTTGETVQYCPLSLLAKHTPHAMRTNLVTWCRYAGLEYEEIALQTGHKNPYSTKIYSKPQVDYFLSLAQSEKLCTVMADGLDEGVFDIRGVRPSLLHSSLQQAFAEDRNATINQFKLFSVDSLFIDTPKSGLIYCQSSPLDQTMFFDHCICPLAAKCPKFVTDSVQDYQRCGLCPIAVYSIEHLDGIQARIRALAFSISNYQHQLSLLDEDVPDIKRDEIAFRLTVDKLEYVALILISKQIESQVEKLSTEDTSYFVRQPEILSKCSPKNIPDDSPFSLFIATLCDFRDYPDMKGGEFMSRLNRLARDTSFLPPETPNYAKVATNKIKSIMKAHNVTLPELILLMDNHDQGLRLSNVAEQK
ncbi:hypothetical protein [Pseudomonas anguilliseptica]|uniref:hypothetical protein n=1 Tax=Pseudomonas anguilliseptica TaxID=53406 RepID=UPI0022AEF3DB|nr:hypothetical protein [Pseudomonas anguilliseptica]MCZ4323239.1 hypothetical protein [Pseudomonas anguilliseptica]